MCTGDAPGGARRAGDMPRQLTLRSAALRVSCRVRGTTSPVLFTAAAMLLLLLLTVATSTHAHIDETVFFRIHSPESVAYIYRTLAANDFGGSFAPVSTRLLLLPADPPEACEALDNALAMQGQVALIKRGACAFAEKTWHAQEAGAVAAIIYDADPDNDKFYVDMILDGIEVDVSIPSLFMLGRDGHHITAALGPDEAAEITIPINETSIFPSEQPPWSFW